MNLFSFFNPHLPSNWSVKHKIGDIENDLGDATSTLVTSTQPAVTWTFTENAAAAHVRLTLLDQHGDVKVEVDRHPETSPGASGGFGNKGGASLIIKCTYQDGQTDNEYRFEGTLLNLPFNA